MCILPQSQLSSDDLAFLTARPAACEPDEDAMQRSLSIHEPAGADFGPTCLSQITRFVPYRSPRRIRKE